MKIRIVGAFGFETMDTGGQPVKTRELYSALCDKYSKENVSFVETYRWKKKPFKMLSQILAHVKKSDVLIMLPAHNGVKIFSKLLLMLKRKKAKVFYDVVGGWLPEKLKNNAKMKNSLQKFDGIWVETSSMKNALEEQGLQNITVVPNFKKLTVLNQEDLVYSQNKPYRLCIFSRVMKEKGVEDAIEAVKYINKKYGETVFALDIYGQIDSRYVETFENMKKYFPNFITYQGVVSPNKSVEVLKNYFALLFPTHYYTEGIPGTIIDAYASGIPVITALWVNSGDIFAHNKTGLGYEFDNYDAFVMSLEKALNDKDAFDKMKTECLLWAKKYQPQTVVEQIDALMKKS